MSFDRDDQLERDGVYRDRTCQHCGSRLRWNGEWYVWSCTAGCEDGDGEDSE